MLNALTLLDNNMFLAEQKVTSSSSCGNVSKANERYSLGLVMVI